jgi:hypothetical protein
VARIIDKQKELKIQFSIVRLKDKICTAEMLMNVSIGQHNIIFSKKKST